MGSPNFSDVSTKQSQIAKLASEDKQRVIKSVNQHIDLAWMLEAYQQTRKDGAVGIDGQTAKEYEEQLEANLESLINRLKSGTYYAPPVKRVYIPKGVSTKEKRPIGIPTFEDKVLQRGVAMVLEPIFESRFRDCSYGYRPKRSAHQALEALWKSMMKSQDVWIIEIDIKGYFDNIDKNILRTFLVEWVQDGVINRIIGKWLQAGIMDGNALVYSEKGTVQGGVISPLLSNLYLHHVLDIWIEDQVKPRLNHGVDLIRFADDGVLVFADKRDAERVYEVIGKRFAKYGLELHPEKTRLIRFQKPDRSADEYVNNHIDFLGFTHYWGKSRRGRWVVQRKTQKNKLKIAIQKMSQWCRWNRNSPLKNQWEKISQKLNGHYGYYGITGNIRSLSKFRNSTILVWKKWLDRRDRNRSLKWESMIAILDRYPLPRTRIVHSVM